MSKNRLLFSLISILVAGQPVIANPLVVLPSGNLACTVTVTSHFVLPPTPPKLDPGTKPAPPIGIIQSIQITAVNGIRRDVLTLSDRTTTETWHWQDTGLILVERIANQARCLYDISKDSPERTHYSPILLEFDAASVNWISPQSLTGTTIHGGKKALHYQATETIAAFKPTGPPEVVIYQAWIDPKTLVPIAFDDSYALYDLAFSDPPTEPLVPPARFQNEHRLYQQAWAAPRPYKN